jgi:hypothetical protein
MSDQKITDLTADTSPTTDDLIVTVNSPSGTPANRKVAISDLFTLAGFGTVLLEQHTASSSASLDFTTAITSTYDRYIFDLVGLVPATSGVDLWMKVSTDGGSTWIAGSSYFYSGRYTSSNATTGDSESSEGGAKIRLNSSQSNASTAFCSGTVNLFHPGSTALHKSTLMDLSYKHTDTHWYRFTNLGGYAATTAVNAVQFLYSSGNIASGTVRCYGVRK